MAESIAKKVEGMEGFADFYRSKIPQSDKDILLQFEQMCRQAYRDLADLIGRDNG